ncbi:transcriptional regulator, AraC family [Chitinophaga pinensis DSM 2588]|uniref:Transcriptional regulator, AraC family n=2 Tax=Chitinophaga pinensis TaxID=79329 RepID=A0A979FZ36_CHIPD|nr:transcriptional regulator, AraC family [Chitinophaga pinensis DSM 2588]
MYTFVMGVNTLDIKEIELLRTLPDLLPVRRDYFDELDITVINRADTVCRNYLSPNRREFYKIVFINAGTGIFTIGLNTYHINQPTILFLHPNDIISWQNLSPDSAATGHFCLFKKSFVEKYPTLKTIMNTHELFTAHNKSVITLAEKDVEAIDGLFIQMHQEESGKKQYIPDTLQAYLQLLIIKSSVIANYPQPSVVSPSYQLLYQFFDLLEEETKNINYAQPIKIKTAAEFADHLGVHPNYLNALLKKHTGQNVSTHIRNRLLEESKVLLLQTDWTLQEIGFAVGFADQPNFSQFFRKNTGITPTEFRKSYLQ